MILKSKNEFLKRRIYAFTADLFCIGIAAKLLQIYIFSFMTKYFPQMMIMYRAQLKVSFHNTNIISTILIFFSYFCLSYYLNNGKTLGKIFFKLKVVHPSKKELSFVDCFKRTIGYMICYFSLFTLFLIDYFRKDGKGIAEYFSKTRTVDTSYRSENSNVYYLEDKTQSIDLNKIKDAA